MKHVKNLTVGPIPRSIMSMTFSMMIGMISIVAFNLIDTYFIGKLGKTALAAMGFTFPVVMLQGAISMGLGVGASSVIALAIGKKDHMAVKRLTTDALILSILLVIIFVVIGLLTLDPLFRLLGANNEQLILIKQYMTIWYLGVPFVVVPMVGNNAIRATGNTLIPSMIMTFSVIINTIMDPLLIFGIGIFPEWGLKGAALATVISRAWALLLSLSFLRFKFNMLTIHLGSFVHIKKSWKKILYIAAPASLVQTLTPLSMGFITNLVASYGDSAIAALGVSNRLEMFALFPLMALSSVMIPFTGQNLGAHQFERIKKGFSFAQIFSLIVGLLAFTIFICFHSFLAKLFVNNIKVISIIGFYLMIVSIGYGFQGIIIVSGAIFSALNYPFKAAGVNILRLIVFLIPLCLISSKLWGLNGIFIAITLTTIATGLISMIWVKRTIEQVI